MNALTSLLRLMNSSTPLMKRCGRSVELTVVSSPPVTDQTLLVIAPIVHPLGCTRATTEGPTPHRSTPSSLEVAVGNKTTGPTPQIIFPALAGDRKNVTLRSP